MMTVQMDAMKMYLVNLRKVSLILKDHLIENSVKFLFKRFFDISNQVILFSFESIITVLLPLFSIPVDWWWNSIVTLFFNNHHSNNCDRFFSPLFFFVPTVDRQLYHVCLLDKQLTEKWVDANDMITFSVPVENVKHVEFIDEHCWISRRWLQIVIMKKRC